MEFIDLKLQQESKLSNGNILIDEINYRISKVLKHGKFILGPEVDELESALAEFVGVDHCICTSSGTDALLVALMAIGIKPGDEVITTPFSFIATAETIALLGAIPIYADIESDTYNLDPNKIKNLITSRTKAIVPVSLYGQPANFEKINQLAKKYNLQVIEDGAQSFGAKQNNKRSCNLSSIGVTSFFPSKPLGCYGDGGACFTNQKEFADKMRKISKHGQSKRYFHTELGINGRIDTIQAAILLAKLPLFEKEVKLREDAGEYYTKKLNSLGIESTPSIKSYNTSVFAQYTIQVDNRNDVQNYLKNKGIPTAVHYPTLLYDQPALNKLKRKPSLKNFFNKQISVNKFNCPIAELSCKRVLSLPMHPGISKSDQNEVTEQVFNAINKY